MKFQSQTAQYMQENSISWNQYVWKYVICLHIIICKQTSIGKCIYIYILYNNSKSIIWKNYSPSHNRYVQLILLNTFTVFMAETLSIWRKLLYNQTILYDTSTSCEHNLHEHFLLLIFMTYFKLHFTLKDYATNFLGIIPL